MIQVIIHTVKNWTKNILILLRGNSKSKNIIINIIKKKIKTKNKSLKKKLEKISTCGKVSLRVNLTPIYDN